MFFDDESLLRFISLCIYKTWQSKYMNAFQFFIGSETSNRAVCALSARAILAKRHPICQYWIQQCCFILCLVLVKHKFSMNSLTARGSVSPRLTCSACTRSSPTFLEWYDNNCSESDFAKPYCFLYSIII